MQWFYDGQIRRYLTQTIRVLSNFVVKYSDGTLVQVPVIYGDQDRQVGAIINQNSASALQSVPKMAVYISGLELDNTRLADATYINKLHLRERDIDLTSNAYTQGQGRNYTIERVMPTPFKLTMKVDIWASSTDQKLQILEQVLVLFNPALEIQTTDNYIDWTSLSVLNVSQINWSSKQVPVGTDTPIDIATITLIAPIWLSPPVKVKHLGVITRIITSIYANQETDNNNYIEGLGQPLAGPTTSFKDLLDRKITTITDYNIQVYNGQAVLLDKTNADVPHEPTLDIPVASGPLHNWVELFEQYPGQYIAGVSKIYLYQPNGTQVVGTIATNPLDGTLLTINYDMNTIPSNTLIDSSGRFGTDPNYDQGTNYRTNSPGTFDAIIDPYKTFPGDGITNLQAGDRFLIIEDIGHADGRTYIDNAGHTQAGVAAWGSLNAHANDVIEWDGTQWNVVFNSGQENSTIVYQTNIYTGVQYVWNGTQWAKSFEGDYRAGNWRIEL